MHDRHSDHQQITPKRLGPKVSTLSLVLVSVMCIGAVFYLSSHWDGEDIVRDDFLAILKMVGGLIIAAITVGSILALRRRRQQSPYTKLMSDESDREG